MTGKSTLLLTFALATLAALPAWAAPPSSGSRSTQTSPSVIPDAQARYAQLPLSFELNQGQTDNRVKFFSRGTGYQLFLTTNEATLVLIQPRTGKERGMGQSSALAVGRARGTNDQLGRRNGVAQMVDSTTLQMTIQGADVSASVTGVDELPGKTNYFIGNDPKKWRTNVPTYAKVKYQGVYPGIDLVYYGNQSGQLEYDFIVAPGIDAKVIALSIERKMNGESLRDGLPVSVDSSGDLVLHDSAGDIRFQKPIVYQENADGKREYRDGRYVLNSEVAGVQKATISFAVGHYDHSKPLVIDPAIAYSTIWGGTADTNGSSSSGTGIAVFTDPSTGHVYAYVVGTTSNSDFPAVNAVQSLFGGGTDAFITKFDPAASGSASVIYSTFLGGSGGDNGTAIAVDSSGNAYVSGLTQSTNFPTVNPYQSMLRSGQRPNAFLTKLSADGSTLLYSTYFGGSGGEVGVAIATDSSGHAYIAGGTFSSDLPLVNPFQATSLNNQGNAFVAGFDTTRAGSASLLYATYLDGPNSSNFQTGGDIAYAVAVDTAGMIHVAGQTSSNQFPVVNGFQLSPSTGAYGGAFYSRLNPSASGSAQLLYSTYLGGSGNGACACIRDSVSAITLDSAGNAYLAGEDVSEAFPTTGSVNQNIPGYTFVSKINPSFAGASSLVYSTVFFTGAVNGHTFVNTSKGIAVDGGGNAFVVGSALPGLQVVNPVLGSANGVLQSSNRGQTWAGLTQGLTDFPILALAIDSSTSPRTIYTGTGKGTVFRTSDGGLNWTQVLQVPSTNSPACSRVGADQPATFCVLTLAVDPTAPSNVYAGTSSGVYTSSDRGSTWTSLNTGLSSTAAQGILALQFDDCLPQCTAATSATLYAGAADGVYVLNPGTTSWVQSSLTADVFSITVDTRTMPHTILTGSDFGDHRGTTNADGSITWTPMTSPGGQGLPALGVDTQPSPSALYGGGGYPTDYVAAIYKSLDEGSTWSRLADPAFAVAAYVPGGDFGVDTSTSPSTVYVMDPSTGIFSSTNGGNSWNSVLANFAILNGSGGFGNFGTMEIDPSTNPPTIYATTGLPNPNAFVAELNPSGSAFLFSTYLGGIASNAWASAIALDASDNIYVTGTTVHPLYFPVVNAFQTPTASNGQGAFFTVLGSQTLPSSSSGSITSQVGVQNGTLAITLPNITGSNTGSTPTLTVNPVPSTTTATYGLSNNLGAFDVSTTASYSGSVTLCFTALTVNDPTTFNNLELFHVVNGTPVNVTSSFDFSTRTVCGTVTSLSPFVLFSPTTSTVLSSSLNPSTYGESVTFTATVAANGGSPTGTVTFYDGSNTLGTGILNSSGQATLNAAGLTSGTHTITAVYGGNGQLLGSTSAGLTETVSKASTTTAITAQSPNPSVAGQPVTVNFTVSPVAPGSGTPAGNVTVSDGAGDTCTGAVAAGSCSIVIPTAGAKMLTASYTGNSNFNSSTSASATHNVTDFSISVSPTSQTLKAGQKTTYTITLTPLAGFTGTVALTCGGVPPNSTCLLSQKSITLTGSGSATIYAVLTTTGRTTKATYTLAFTGIFGTGTPATGGLTHSAKTTLIVQ